ncbi:MAG TPA: chemotaxis-specific protein-glutamate methyltransferase CheB [Bacillota bacterium]|nr:chemotaxis-specific protein-glutamate methyltransferase CheB [Bacillota bacterium]
MKQITVLIVDDSFFMRKVIGDFLRLDPDITVVGEAANGQEALEKIAELAPQVVTLDIEMPGMNGVETLRAIVAAPRHPSVVMVSGYVEKGGALTLQCLALGAADFVLKPSGSFSLDMEKVHDLLVQKVKIAAAADTTKIKNVVTHQHHTHQMRYADSSGIVVVGASTGGPAALEILLPAFPDNFPYSVVVAQHLPQTFTASFVGRLQERCSLHVTRAEPDTALRSGTIYIAAGGTTTTIGTKNDQPTLFVEPNDQDIETPSVNKLMTSAAEAYQNHTIGIILTGMGKDGVEGMTRIKQLGGKTIVQDEATSVIFGMGREVVTAGVADNTVPLGLIAKTVIEGLAV